MDWMHLFYFSMGAVLCFGARICGRGERNADAASREQTTALRGIAMLFIVLHHLAQKTSAPWLPPSRIVPGLELFPSFGYPPVAVFLFCSGLGLYKSLRCKKDYLKHFVRRRIVPVVVAFYLSEFVYTGVRLLAGEEMDAAKLLLYLSGLRMANPYSWYVIVIPFFYLAFLAAFRFCKREGTAIMWVFIFTFAYTALGVVTDHQNVWWMRGEWWYNSIILFPLGLLFAKYENRVLLFFRKGTWLWILLFFVGTILLFRLSERLNIIRWGYYGEGAPDKNPRRLKSVSLQWLVCLVFTAFWFLLLTKVRFGSRTLAWIGGMTLEIYLMHGLFAELFGFDFLGIAQSRLYIRSLPVYIAAVFSCTVPAAILFRLLRLKVTSVLTGGGRPGLSADRPASPQKAER